MSISIGARNARNSPRSSGTGASVASLKKRSEGQSRLNQGTGEESDLAGAVGVLVVELELLANQGVETAGPASQD